MALSRNLESFALHSPVMGRGGNLNYWQKLFCQRYGALSPQLRHGREFGCIVLGFKSNSDCGTRFEPLDPSKPIRQAESVRMFSLTPIRLQSRGGYQRAPEWRLHFMVQAAGVKHGEVWFRGRDSYAEAYQADLAKEPWSDFPTTQEEIFNSTSFGEQLVKVSHQPELSEGALKSPIGGKVAAVQDDLWLRITVAGNEVYRFPLNIDRDTDARDVPKEVQVLKDGEIVVAGDSLVQLTGRITYLRAIFSASGKPKIERVCGDRLNASRLPDILHAAQRLLSEMEAYCRGQISPSAVNMLPVSLIELPASVVASRRVDVSGWRPNAAFKLRLLKAVSPDTLGSSAALRVRAPATGTLMVDDRGSCFRQLVFSTTSGDVALGLPSCSEIDIKEGDEVTAGQEIGDYIARAYYGNYEQLVEVAGGSEAKIEDAFFDSLLIHPGQKGWTGKTGSVCVEESLLDESFQGMGIGHWLDFSNLFANAGSFDEEWKTLVGPAIPYDVSHGLELYAHGVNYSLAPFGERFSYLLDRRDTTAPVRKNWVKKPFHRRPAMAVA